MLPKSSSLRMGRRLNGRSLVHHSRCLQCRHHSIRNQHSRLGRRRESCHRSRDPLCDRCHRIAGTQRLDLRFLRQRTRDTCSYPDQPGKGKEVNVRNLRMISIWTTLLRALLSHRALLRLVQEGFQRRTIPSQQSCKYCVILCRWTHLLFASLRRSAAVSKHLQGSYSGGVSHRYFVS
jgi:hypothetical protein